MRPRTVGGTGHKLARLKGVCAIDRHYLEMGLPSFSKGTSDPASRAAAYAAHKAGLATQVIVTRGEKKILPKEKQREGYYLVLTTSFSISGDPVTTAKLKEPCSQPVLPLFALGRLRRQWQRLRSGALLLGRDFLSDHSLGPPAKTTRTGRGSFSHHPSELVGADSLAQSSRP